MPTYKDVTNIDNSQSLNGYSYAQINPVTLTDPLGQSPSTKNIIVGAVHGLLDVAEVLCGRQVTGRRFCNGIPDARS
ncbi:MAG: hypothetical protein HDT39_01110 [Lachnospiraceae bacterium]|nr:hypothetical protein [Lachnospiraceae bacterium]